MRPWKEKSDGRKRAMGPQRNVFHDRGRVEGFGPFCQGGTSGECILHERFF